MFLIRTKSREVRWGGVGGGNAPMVPTTLWVEVCAEFEVASRCALGGFRDGRDFQTPDFRTTMTTIR